MKSPLLAVVLALLLSSLSAGIQAGQSLRMLSLDLCSDWLLSSYVTTQQVTRIYSPLSRRYALPFGARAAQVHQGSLEHILSLHPDVVVVSGANAWMLQQRLLGLGVRVVSLPLPQSLTQLAHFEQRVRVELGLTAPSQATLRHTVKPRGRLLLLGPNGIGTGLQTLENDLLVAAGWRNYLQQDGYARLDLERIVRDPPDAIVWANADAIALANRFAEHAVLSRVVPASQWLLTDAWRWQCPGFWTYDLIEQLQP